ncbi:nuclear pore protein-like protein [Colletotrichum sojae]|uniref:Nuclear pore protein-like protein n=1 Tax=Colletotrichum sojae TaxID=2175907 RepID=A0A8H6IPY6_9PEZI|nr:nuclear pore protein-like protein [Colletotrichum sojae]
MSSTDLIELDPRGEVVFVVGAAAPENTPARRFRLCSRTMARVSPVFDRMLHGNFSESKPAAADASGPDGSVSWVVDLPDDNAAAFDLFASIAHSSFQRVPRGLSIDRLYDLTVLTHYYDATPMLTPWLQGWINGIGETPDGGEEGMLMPKLLWISWELGHKQLFETTARRMVMECRGVFVGDEAGLEGLHMPPDVMERIASIRTATIQAIMDVFRDLAEKLVVIDEGPRWCRHASYMGPHRCESMILGSMTFCLTRAGLWPIPDAVDVDESVVGLYSSLMNLVIHDIGRPGERTGADHSECNPRGFLMGRIKDILADVQNPVTEAHRKHLDKQIRKLLV